MFKRTKVSAGVLAALGGVLVLGAQPAFAQTTGERVEITGSRLKSFDVETASPVVTLGAEAIKVEGVRNVEQLLNNLPQVFADQGATVSNGATGTATVNLRNFGSTRTLVLVNGRRLPAGSPRDPSNDLNQIPISLIKRVEILTGGASAVYGSDAVAGVVNFILRDNFEGVQVDLNTQFYNHKQKGDIDSALAARNFARPGNKSHDGEVHDLSVTLGGNFAGGKGNATVFVSYKKEEALLESERDFSACALNYNRNTGFSCGGSGTSYPGQFTDFASYALTVADAQGGVRDYNGTLDAYNFGPLNYFQRPSERWGINALAHYDISEKFRVYTEVSMHDDHTVAQIAPSGLFFFGATGANAIRFENPLLSQAWRDALGLAAAGDTAELYIGRRNVEGGGRRDDVRHTSYRIVQGMKGDVGNFSYDVSGQVSRVLFQETYFNDFSNTRIGRALNVVADPATGNPVCQSVLDGTDPNCVPYDIWRLGGVTPAALSYLQTPGFQRGLTAQSVLTASLSGDLGEFGLKSPMAKNGLGFVVGLERRNERLELNVDPGFETGDLAGQGGPTNSVGGAYSVKDFFSELRFPIMEKQPFAELLNLTATYRRSSYSTSQKTNTYGMGLEYAPVKMVKARASYQRAARAANVVELFSPSGLGLYDGDPDPCSGAINPQTGVVEGGASFTECARTGVTQAQYGHIVDSPAGQYNAIFGGNPSLKPETAKSYTLGLVVNPIDNMTLTLDYFNMKVEDVVGTAPPGTTLGLCLGGDAAACSLVHRDGVGTLWATNDAYIVATNLNLGFKHTTGLDIGFDYGMKLPGFGGLDFSFLGTRLQKFEVEDIPGVGSYDCAGLYGNVCGTPLPKWRHKVRTTWTSPWDVNLALTWRYIAGVTSELDETNPLLKAPTTAVLNAQVKELGARNYFDLAASYALTKNVALRAVVNNVFDKDPPLRTNGSGFVNGNTYPVVYDALGRKVGLSLTATF
jgi:iron complex outermembrane recepter protein